MKKTETLHPALLLRQEIRSILKGIYENRLRILLVFFVAYLLFYKDLSLSLDLGSGQIPSSAISGLVTGNESKKPMPEESGALFLDPQSLKAKGKSQSAEAKRSSCKAYIARFSPTAVGEMKQFGIPASITLAQGLLESNSGKSRLARENNNHFGMKCFSKKCKKGHCSNYNDDHHKDFFRSYEKAWDSYRAHSLLLSGKRYAHLKKLGKTDYKSWAIGLQKAGYATDSRYSAKLIDLIETFDLSRFDR